MTGRYLLDTNALISWFVRADKLSREQRRIIEAERRAARDLGLSAMSLVELAFLRGKQRNAHLPSLDEFLRLIEDKSTPLILPITPDIVREAAVLHPILADPSDCIIAATARVHNLTLITSDQRILDSRVVRTVE